MLLVVNAQLRPRHLSFAMPRPRKRGFNQTGPFRKCDLCGVVTNGFDSSERAADVLRCHSVVPPQRLNGRVYVCKRCRSHGNSRKDNAVLYAAESNTALRHCTCDTFICSLCPAPTRGRCTTWHIATFRHLPAPPEGAAFCCLDSGVLERA